MRALAVGFLLALGACASSDVLNEVFGPDGRTIRETIGTFPAEQQLGFGLMEKRCTKCHTLNQPFSAHVPAGGWRAQVHKMARKAGSGVSEDDEVRIAGFLEYYGEQRRTAKAGEKK